jgi:5-formyltetrahydrofolate cyclo-ligase
MARRHGTGTLDHSSLTLGRTHPDPLVAEAKAAMRDRVRADRAARTLHHRRTDADALADVVLELPEVQAARCVSVYASMPSEPGTTPLRAALAAAGIRVLLPIVLSEGQLEWAVDAGELRPVRGLGGAEPVGPRLGRAAIRTADVVLVPALAIDTLGHRLGQGAGYYDRALPLVAPNVPVIAIVHDGEVLDAAVQPIPVEPHDRRVDAVVTPVRCLRIG